MPELPEVETIRRGIEEHLIPGCRIMNIFLTDQAFQKNHTNLNEPQKLTGAIFKKVGRKGKVLFLHLNDGYLAFHLGMSGQIVTDLSRTRYPEHNKMQIDFGDRSLFYIDIRKFGWIRHSTDLLTLLPKGEDPISNDFNMEKVIKKISQSQRYIKNLLMDQNIIAGIGNIYANEILFKAGIHPLTSGKSLEINEIHNIIQTVDTVLNDGIKNYGTTFSIFRNLKGESGQQQNFLQVYGRENEDCYQCGTTINRIMIGGRSTFYCEKCQGVR